MFDRTALGDGEAIEVHEAGHIAADEDVRVRFQDMVELERAHPPGNVGESDGKGAAETAALLGLAERSDKGVFDGFQELQGCLAAASAAAMAGAMEGDAGGFRKFSRPFFDAETVVDEVHDLPSPAGERVDGAIWIFLELERISMEIHRRARAGGDDDRKFSREHGSGMAGYFP